MSEEMHNTTTYITGNTNSTIVNASEHTTAATNIHQTQNQPIDASTTELIKQIYDHLGSETGRIVEPLIKQAAEEAKKAERDDSKTGGILSVLESFVKGALLLPEAIEAFDKWKHLIGF